MSHFTSGNTPGLQARVESAETQIWWAGRGGQSLIATQPITLDSAVVDAGNSPTTTIRGGQVLALNSSGKAVLYDPDATDGTQIAVGRADRTCLWMASPLIASHKCSCMAW